MNPEIPAGMKFQASPSTSPEVLRHILEGESPPFPGNCSIIEYFRDGLTSGRIDGSKPAIIRDDCTLTFQELDDSSERISSSLKKRMSTLKNENPDGDIVIGVCMEPSERLIQTLFGILKMGGAYVPIDVSFPEERVKRVVEGASPLMVICDNEEKYTSKFDQVKGPNFIVVTLRELLNEEDQGKEGTKIGAEETAIILYTSGSSGEPKGVRLSHRAAMNRLYWQWKIFPYIPNEVCCFKTALTFVDSVPEIFGPLLRGVQLVVFTKAVTSRPEILIVKLGEYGITRLVLVPSLLRAIYHTINIMKLNGIDGLAFLRALRIWVCSGENLALQDVLKFFEFFPENTILCNFYGSTEIMGDVTFEVFGSEKDVYAKIINNSVPIGNALFNTQIYLLNEKLEVVPEGGVGEIFVSGLNLASGYVGIKNSDKFIRNPHNFKKGYNILYRTGDYGHIGKISKQGKTLYYEGRLDSQIKVRGHRVDLNEIQATLNSIRMIEKSIVLCHNPGGPDQAIVAFVVKRDEEDGPKSLDNVLHENLREYEVPEVLLLAELPLLINGKVDRQMLLKKYANRGNDQKEIEPEEIGDFEENKQGIAKIFIEIMSGVTGTLKKVIVDNLDKSFFELGGTSLNSVQVILMLRERGLSIGIPEFVSAKSIREIVNLLKELDNSSEGIDQDDKPEVIEGYQVEKLDESHREDVIAIIAASFSEKGDLERYTGSTFEEFGQMIRSAYDLLMEKGFSFVVKRTGESGEVIAAALLFDFYDEPEEFDASPGIAYSLELLEKIETAQKPKLPQGKGQILHSFMMGTAKGVSESENVKLIELLEASVVRMARDADFIGIITTNTNPLTQQMAKVMGYTELEDYQPNAFSSKDGSKPFAEAPDTFRVICTWKSFQLNI